MVTIQNKFHVEGVVFPLLEGLDDSVELFVISGVSLPKVIEFFTKEGNWVAFLAKCPSDAHT